MENHEIAGQVDLVRKVAKPALARFAKVDAEGCTESYLFSSDRFCGIRIRLGPFEALWRLGSENVEIARGGHTLQMLAIDGDARQRSAA